MNVEYEITKDDLIAFNLYHFRNSPNARRQYFRVWLLFPCVWLLIWITIGVLASLKRGEGLQTFLDLLPLLSGVPFYLLYYPWSYRRRVRKIVEDMLSEGQNRTLFCRHRLTISPDGVADFGEFDQYTTTWPAVEKTAVSENYFYIYTNALAAIIIPSRSFASSAEFEEFMREAKEYHTTAMV
jgi:hypothetical protein